MGDNVPSQSKGLLKRQRSVTLTPRSDVFGDNDFVPSFMSIGFGGAVFANDLNDNPLPFPEDDTVGSIGSNYGRGNGLPREPVNEFYDWNPDISEHIPRTRSKGGIIEAIKNDGLLDFVPSLTPRARPDPSGRTPRSRQDLSSVDDVKLVLVGTTLVAKTANDQIKLDMEALSSNLDKHKKNFLNLELSYPGGAANMQNSRNFQLTVKGNTLSGVLFGNGTCKLSQVAIQPSHPNVKPIFTELQRLINEVSSAGPHSCISGASRFEFKDVNISLLKQQFKLPFSVKYSRVEELLTRRPLYFSDVSPNRPQTGQGVRFKLTAQLSLMLQVKGTVGAQVYYSGMIQVDGSKNCSVDEHEIVCKWIRQFFIIHADEIQPQSEDVADGSKRKRARPAKSPKE